MAPLVQCTVDTLREPLKALTQDGVQFQVDVFIRYSANCSDPSVIKILQNLAPDASGTVSAGQLYLVYVRPTLLEVVREMVSLFKANDINDKRETVLQNHQRGLPLLQTAKMLKTRFLRCSCCTHGSLSQLSK